MTDIELLKLAAKESEGATMTAPDSTRSAVVDRTYHWRPITPDTPRGCKLQLINRAARVATYGALATDPGFWTHWAPLPTFDD